MNCEEKSKIYQTNETNNKKITIRVSHDGVNIVVIVAFFLRVVSSSPHWRLGIAGLLVW